jgi:exosome complex component RRP4
MVNTLKELTGCDLLVAVNGRIHVKCPNEDVEAVAILAIKMIEREAHTTGLTNRVKRFIEEERRLRGV